MDKPPLVIGVVAGAVLGVLVAALWWLRLDARTCVGGSCEGTPAGTTALLVGGACGAVLGSLAVLVRGRTRRR